MDFVQMGELARVYGWDFFPVLYDTFPDPKIQLYINCLQVLVVFNLIFLYYMY